MHRILTMLATVYRSDVAVRPLGRVVEGDARPSGHLLGLKDAQPAAVDGSLARPPAPRRTTRVARAGDIAPRKLVAVHALGLGRGGTSVASATCRGRLSGRATSWER